jgi:hypothetical protein
MMGNNFLAGYASPFADKIELVFDHAGPASYVNSGTFNTSGDIINASDLGIGGIEYVDIDGLSSDNLDYIWVEYRGGGYGNALASVVLHWFVLATAAEVANGVNLSAKTVRVKVRGV